MAKASLCFFHGAKRSAVGVTKENGQSFSSVSKCASIQPNVLFIHCSFIVIAVGVSLEQGGEATSVLVIGWLW